MLRTIGLALITGSIPGAVAQEPVDMTAYSILASDGPAEIRTYAPQIVAEVTVEAGSLSEAASKGFRPLAGYIFGGNSPQQKIAMTSPVTAARQGQTIAMTSPVTASPDARGAYLVRFIMPAEWTMETLPAPTNPDIRLAELPGRTVAALRYTGRDTTRARSEAEAGLRTFIARQGYGATGEAEWAGYDSPMVPFWMRRYEIMLPVAAANKE